MPCDCSLEGSTSLQCSPLTGQCPCLVGAGITGRRCDQCVSPLAEMIAPSNGRASSTTNETSSSSSTVCRQLASHQCPKHRYMDMIWPRTTVTMMITSPGDSSQDLGSSQRANTSCPRGARGRAYRTCEVTSHWLRDVDVSECQSSKLVDGQLVRLAQELDTSKTELNSYQVCGNQNHQL